MSVNCVLNPFGNGVVRVGRNDDYIPINEINCVKNNRTERLCKFSKEEQELTEN